MTPNLSAFSRYAHLQSHYIYLKPAKKFLKVKKGEYTQRGQGESNRRSIGRESYLLTKKPTHREAPRCLSRSFYPLNLCGQRKWLTSDYMADSQLLLYTEYGALNFRSQGQRGPFHPCYCQDWTQNHTQARQALCHWAIFPEPVSIS